MKRDLTLILSFFLLAACNDSNPYEEGMHLDYNIHCEEGFLYKTMNQGRGTIPLLNSDGTRVKCGSKRF